MYKYNCATSLHLIMSHYITEKWPFKFPLSSEYQILFYILTYFSESYLKPITMPASGSTFRLCRFCIKTVHLSAKNKQFLELMKDLVSHFSSG